MRGGGGGRPGDPRPPHSPSPQAAAGRDRPGAGRARPLGPAERGDGPGGGPRGPQPPAARDRRGPAGAFPEEAASRSPPPSHPAAPHSGEERATARGAGNKSYTETRCRFSPFNFASRNLHRSENITRFKQALLKSYRNVKNACGLKSLRHVIYPKSPKNGKRTFLRAKGDKFFRLLINWKESTGVFFFFFFLSKPCVAYGNSRTPTFVNAEVTLQTE